MYVKGGEFDTSTPDSVAAGLTDTFNGLHSL